MNSLSWMIYAIQIAGNITELSLFITIFGSVGIATACLFSYFEEAPQWRQWVLSRMLPIVLVAVSIFIFAPNRKTLLLIAASQYGEKLVQSDDVKSVVNPGIDLLKAWIKSETERLAKKDQ